MSEPTYPTQDPNQNPYPSQVPQAEPAPQAAGAYSPSQVFAQGAQAGAAYQQQAQQAADPAYQQARPAQAAAPQRAAGFQQAASAPAYATPQAGAAAGPAAKRASGWVNTLISGVIGAVIATATTVAISAAGILPTGGTQQVESSNAATVVASTDGGTTINVTGDDVSLPEVVAAKSLPSVVCIYVYQEQNAYGWFGQESAGEQMSGLGSGVILSEDGYVITNYHVIEGESSLKVSVNNEQYDAEVVGTDPSSDLAVIKINGAEGLTPIEVGSSSDLVVGEWVMTVGAPYGMEQSVGAGIVSAVSRSSASLQDTDGGAIYANLIQTDAPINPGNSGGALVDKNGKLVGINTLTASYSGSNSGVGFAIPSDYAVSIANQIIAGEEPSHAQLGVSIVSVDAATAQRYGLSVNEGAYVAAAYAGAAEAGIEEGDIITKINGKKVTSGTDVILAVRSSKVGDTVSVEFNRNGETKTVDVVLGSDTESSGSAQNAQEGQRSQRDR